MTFLFKNRLKANIINIKAERFASEMSIFFAKVCSGDV